MRHFSWFASYFFFLIKLSFIAAKQRKQQNPDHKAAVVFVSPPTLTWLWHQTPSPHFPSLWLMQCLLPAIPVRVGTRERMWELPRSDSFQDVWVVRWTGREDEKWKVSIQGQAYLRGKMKVRVQWCQQTSGWKGKKEDGKRRLQNRKQSYKDKVIHRRGIY